jgi:hypothetical protein
MTTAVCVRCGAMKFGAFTTCQQCPYTPDNEHDVLYSLAFTDHYYDQLSSMRYPNISRTAFASG